MEALRDWLIQIGWSQEAAGAVSIVAAIVVSMLIGWALHGLASAPLLRALNPSESWRKAIDRWRVVQRTALVVVIIAASAMIVPLLEPWPQLQQWIDVFLDALMVLAIAGVASGFTSALVDVFGQRDTKEQRLPFKALGQALQVIIWTYAGVALLSVITGQNVMAILTGLTAVGAVLVLVFRDPILGWTAGVQVAVNDLVRVGDWISVPKHDADGTVEEIALTTVKVRNWDKTISTLPTYALVSEGFRNWRGMYASGARRVKRAIAIDAGSVRFCDRRLLERLARDPLMRELLQPTGEGTVAPVAGAAEIPERGPDSDTFSDPRPTNLGCFRAWLEAWLEQHPKIDDRMIAMVRELEPEGRGIPVEIYVFSNDQRWEHYERLQAEILDHVVAILPEFELRVFQEPSGEDVRASVTDTGQ